MVKVVPVLRNQLANWLFSVVSAGAILYFGSPLFIPLSFALLISFVLLL